MTLLPTDRTHFIYTGNALETVFLTRAEQILVKNFMPVCPPGMLESTKQSNATTCTTAAIVVRIVDCKLSALYSVPIREIK